MRLLDLCCGAGGAAAGYQMAGFYVVGVDHKPQPRYCGDEFYQSDAMEYPLGGFDVVHCSPPCQAYSRCTPTSHRDNHPRLISQIRKRLRDTGRPYVIENVADARDRLICPIMLCGSMFGLPIRRHRYFEIFPLGFFLTPPCSHGPETVYITGTPRPKDGSPRRDPSAQKKRAAMATPWMTIKEMDEAIPPAYTDFIGKKLMDIIKKT